MERVLLSLQGQTQCTYTTKTQMMVFHRGFEIVWGTKSLFIVNNFTYRLPWIN